MVRLPVVLWHYIFEFCDQNVISNIMESIKNRDVRSLIERKHQNVMIDFDDGDPTCEVVSVFGFPNYMFQFTNLRKLQISSINIKILKSIDFSRFGWNLRELSITIQSSVSEKIVFPKLPKKLEKLVICNNSKADLVIPKNSLKCFEYSNFNLEHSTGVKFECANPSMQTMSIIGADTKAGPESFPNLKSLTMITSEISPDVLLQPDHFVGHDYTYIPKYSLSVIADRIIDVDSIKHLRHLVLIKPIQFGVTEEKNLDPDLSFISEMPNLLTLRINWHVEYDEIIQHVPESLYSITINTISTKNIRPEIEIAVYRTVTEF